MSARSPSDRTERDRFVDDLLAYMTLEEKAGQLVALPQAPAPGQRLSARDHADFFDRLRAGTVGAVAGITQRSQAEALQRIAIEESRLGIPLLIIAVSDGGSDTAMPSPVAAAASWDPAAIEAAEAEVAVAARAKGINWTLGPEVRLAEDGTHPDFAQSCGANAFLATRIAAARINGLQRTNAGDETGMLAALVIPEETDNRGDARSDEGADFATTLVASTVAGSILVEQGAHRDGPNREASNTTALDYAHRPGAFAGILLNEWGDLAALAGQEHLTRGFMDLSPARLVAAVQSGRVPQSRLDDAVRRVLAAKFNLGLFRTRFSPAVAAGSPVEIRQPRAKDAALDLARRSLILLRNEGQLLPLGLESQEVLVVGSAAADRHIALGGRDGVAASVIDGLDQLGIGFKYAPGLALRHEGTSAHRLIEADRMAIGMASEAARRAHAVVVVLGSGLPDARYDALGEAQRQLVSALRAVNERIVLISLGARPINPAVNGSPLPCVLHAGQLGTMSGHAIAEVLTGEVEPVGRLPAPLIARDPSRSLPFGFGLGHGKFRLSNLALEVGNDRVLASLDLRNISEMPGSEVIQLHIRPGEPVIRRGHQTMRDFQRVSLPAGGRTRTTFEIGARQFGTLGADGRLVFESGSYEISLGLDSRRLHGGSVTIPANVVEAMLALEFGAGRAAVFGQFSGLRRA